MRLKISGYRKSPCILIRTLQNGAGSVKALHPCVSLLLGLLLNWVGPPLGLPCLEDYLSYLPCLLGVVTPPPRNGQLLEIGRVTFSKWFSVVSGSLNLRVFWSAILLLWRWRNGLEDGFLQQFFIPTYVTLTLLDTCFVSHPSNWILLPRYMCHLSSTLLECIHDSELVSTSKKTIVLTFWRSVTPSSSSMTSHWLLFSLTMLIFCEEVCFLKNYWLPILLMSPILKALGRTS